MSDSDSPHATDTPSFARFDLDLDVGSPQEAKQILESISREALEAANLPEDAISIRTRSTFAVETAIITAVIHLGSQAAFTLFKEVILPKIKERVGVKSAQEKPVKKSGKPPGAPTPEPAPKKRRAHRETQ